jgi:hypothetical protein
MPRRVLARRVRHAPRHHKWPLCGRRFHSRDLNSVSESERSECRWCFFHPGRTGRAVSQDSRDSAATWSRLGGGFVNMVLKCTQGLFSAPCDLFLKSVTVVKVLGDVAP